MIKRACIMGYCPMSLFYENKKAYTRPVAILVFDDTLAFSSFLVCYNRIDLFCCSSVVSFTPMIYSLHD